MNNTKKLEEASILILSSHRQVLSKHHISTEGNWFKVKETMRVHTEIIIKIYQSKVEINNTHLEAVPNPRMGNSQLSLKALTRT
jgi:hypothetical protein